MIRSIETCIGSGKRFSEILYEMNGVAENIARKAISIVASKMPIKTQFIISR
ncbi:hypothetical protein REPUB_Repub02eG0111500 [Reevesia pubescens]